MNDIRIMMISKRKVKRTILITVASIIGIYLIITLYFINHFFFRTEINGINLSMKSHKKVMESMQNYLNDYKLELMERDGRSEIIKGQEIELQCNHNFDCIKLHSLQNPLLWLPSLFKKNTYLFDDLYQYNNALLDNRINNLHCLNKSITPPQNAGFRYNNFSYAIVEERNGDQINQNRFKQAIYKSISLGFTKLNLHKMNCYDNPTYTSKSEKILSTRAILNRYVSTKITYHFGKQTEVLDGSLINDWITINDQLEVTIDKEQIAKYISYLSKKYDTVGIIRQFKASTGRIVSLKGGLYGWKINRDLEGEALLFHIMKGEVLEKEPEYIQTAFSREGNEIGDTYIEINITRQHVWFYKNGKMLVQGDVVTGNPSRGNATVLGAYMINYKQLNATLVGENYASKVTYWMPFFGNMGLHDASWRYRFGGNIYKTKGSHGCVNAPLYLAKKVYENVESGTPVIVYEEE